MLRRMGLAITLLSFLVIASFSAEPANRQHHRIPLFGVASMGGQYEESEFIVIHGNTELAEAASAGTGTESDPFIINNLRIKSPVSCIRIYETSDWFVIRNCDLRTTSVSYEAVVQFYLLQNGVIEDCYLSGATTGVQINCSSNCRVSNCYSQDNNGNGVYVYQSSECIITGCHIYANYKGIMFQESRYCTVQNNDIYRNAYVGVEFDTYSHNNSVIDNRFGWNFVREWGETHGRDNGLNNSFDDGVGTGNAYSDYNASEPYLIAGNAHTVDHFASDFSDDTRPTIEPIPDFAFDIETVGNVATWTARDSLPFAYVAYLNTIEWMNEVWDGRDLVIRLDRISLGTHNLTVEILDGAENRNSDTVFVTVVSFVLGGMGTDLVMIASGITVLSLVLLLVLIKKFY